jgi:hypothetical protein
VTPVDPLEALLARDAAWNPPRAELESWLAEAVRAGSPPALLQEARWWQAHEAASRSDWDRVTELAQEGIGEPFSEREGIRIALLHAISGDVEQAEHVLSQVIQWRGDATLLGRFGEACAAEGLVECAERFRRISGGGSPSPSAASR